jgi:hypothetical protein
MPGLARSSRKGLVEPNSGLVKAISYNICSITDTCEFNRVNPIDYLGELQRHAEELKQTPSEWMPWNYRETLARTGAIFGCGIGYAESCMVEKDSLWPWESTFYARIFRSPFLLLIYAVDQFPASRGQRQTFSPVSVQGQTFP